MISTADLGTLNNSARNSRQSLLAAPSTGGDVSRIFSAWSCTPHTSFFDARGWMWRVRTMPSLLRTQRACSDRLIAGELAGKTFQKGFKTHLELDFLTTDVFNPGLEFT